MSNKLTNVNISQELTILKRDLEQLSRQHDELHKDIREIKFQLLDPDNGAIARVNRNTEFRQGATKALWIIYTALVGIIIKLFMS